MTRPFGISDGVNILHRIHYYSQGKDYDNSGLDLSDVKAILDKFNITMDAGHGKYLTTALFPGIGTPSESPPPSDGTGWMEPHSDSPQYGQQSPSSPQYAPAGPGSHLYTPTSPHAPGSPGSPQYAPASPTYAEYLQGLATHGPVSSPKVTTPDSSPSLVYKTHTSSSVASSVSPSPGFGASPDYVPYGEPVLPHNDIPKFLIYDEHVRPNTEYMSRLELATRLYWWLSVHASNDKGGLTDEQALSIYDYMLTIPRAPGGTRLATTVENMHTALRTQANATWVDWVDWTGSFEVLAILKLFKITIPYDQYGAMEPYKLVHMSHDEIKFRLKMHCKAKPFVNGGLDENQIYELASYAGLDTRKTFGHILNQLCIIHNKNKFDDIKLPGDLPWPVYHDQPAHDSVFRYPRNEILPRLKKTLASSTGFGAANGLTVGQVMELAPYYRVGHMDYDNVLEYLSDFENSMLKQLTDDYVPYYEVMPATHLITDPQINYISDAEEAAEKAATEAAEATKEAEAVTAAEEAAAEEAKMKKLAKREKMLAMKKKLKAAKVAKATKAVTVAKAAPLPPVKAPGKPSSTKKVSIRSCRRKKK